MRAFKVVRNLTIVAAVCAIVFLIVYLVYESKFEKSSDYTETQHIQRVTDLANKRYLNDDTDYTELQVYPLYDENDKLTSFLIELKPVGFMYVFLNHNSKLNHFGNGMYLQSTSNIKPWARYVVENGNDAYLKIYNTTYKFNDRRWTELDENDMPVLHETSHFKTANIQYEKRYFLKYRSKYIPAVKRNDKFLNLISMEYMDINYKDEIIDQPTIDFIALIPEPAFKL